MNDELDDELDGDRVIARVRSALDEVAAGVDDDEGLIPLRPRRDVPRRWLGIAAATAVLAGGAALAISRRSADDPAAEPTPTSTVVTAEPSTSVATEPVVTTSTTVAPQPTTPWFALDMPGFVGGDVVQQVAPTDSSVLFQAAYTVTRADVRGFLTVVYDAELTAGIEGDYTSEELDVPDGTAYFLRPNLDGAPRDHGFEIRWFHSDGSAWLFRSQGLDRDTFVSTVLAAQAGSGLPIVIADPAVVALSMGAPSDVVLQDYQNETGLVRVWVDRSGAALQDLIGAANIIDVTVAGMPGHAALMDDNRIEVTWDTGQDGWWGHLSIAPELSRGADGIIAAVVPAA